MLSRVYPYYGPERYQKEIEVPNIGQKK